MPARARTTRAPPTSGESADAASPEDVEASSAEESEAGEGETTRDRRRRDDATIPTCRTRARPARRAAPTRRSRTCRRWSTTTPSPPASTRSVKAEDLCDIAELDRLRSYLDKQLAHLQQRRRPARQPPAAAPDGAAEPRLGFRPRGRPDRCRAALARHHRPDASALLQGRARHRVPRHGRDAASRQFRLDARPPDHGRRDLRRHPRPHARALRRQGRDPRLHHARLEGRAVARSLAAGRASRPIPAASTTSATSSTRPPTRPGGARAAISA